VIELSPFGVYTSEELAAALGIEPETMEEIAEKNLGGKKLGERMVVIGFSLISYLGRGSSNHPFDMLRFMLPPDGKGYDA
jgi:hypothetical protein